MDWSVAGRPDINPSWILDLVPGNTATLAIEPKEGLAMPATDQDRPFMTIPMETDPVAGGIHTQSTDDFWAAQGSGTSPSMLAHPSDFTDSASVDIFDELATLERQESIQQSQFIHNLGFPDLDLARFFGADYQLSDPLIT
jgi:hypothetical protein